MGQKVHPIGFRLGVIRTWESNWYAEKDYAQLLHEDLKLRNYLKERLHHAGISKVEIERAANRSKVIVFTARPGMVIGKGGKGIETLKTTLAPPCNGACHPRGQRRFSHRSLRARP